MSTGVATVCVRRAARSGRAPTLSWRNTSCLGVVAICTSSSLIALQQLRRASASALNSVNSVIASGGRSSAWRRSCWAPARSGAALGAAARRFGELRGCGASTARGSGSSLQRAQLAAQLGAPCAAPRRSRCASGCGWHLAEGLGDLALGQAVVGGRARHPPLRLEELLASDASRAASCWRLRATGRACLASCDRLRPCRRQLGFTKRSTAVVPGPCTATA